MWEERQEKATGSIEGENKNLKLSGEGTKKSLPSNLTEKGQCFGVFPTFLQIESKYVKQNTNFLPNS